MVSYTNFPYLPKRRT